MKYLIISVLLCTALISARPYLFDRLEGTELTQENNPKYIQEIKEDLSLLLMNDIIVFDSSPMSYAKVGKTIEGGARILLTTSDSILAMNQVSSRWANRVINAENIQYLPNGKYFGSNEIEKPEEKKEVVVVFREKMSQVYISRSLYFYSGLILFIVSFFVLSTALNWLLWQKTLFVIIVFGIHSYTTSTFFNISPDWENVFGAPNAIIMYKGVQLALFSATLLLFQRTKKIFSSMLHFQSLQFILICLSAPLFFYMSIEMTGHFYDEFKNSHLYISVGTKFWEAFDYYYYGYAFALANLTVFGVSQYKISKESRLKTEREKLNIEAQLNSLQARLNPHFLYNSLNSIASLIKAQPEKAEEMTLSVSRFMKDFSNRNSRHLIDVSEEVKMIEEYLGIEKIRFDESLQYTISVSPLAKREKFPRAILQPLVENAIKYGYDSSTKSINIMLNIDKVDGRLEVKLYDSGQLWSDDLEKGYGISSVYNKLDLFYGEYYDISFVNTPAKHISISVDIDKIQIND